MFTKTCARKKCGKTFTTKKRTLKYCCVECYRAATREQRDVKKTCENCGKSFMAQNKRAKYCCVTCYNQSYHRPNRKVQVPKTCPTCKKDFTPKRKSVIYCCQKCGATAKYRLYQKQVEIRLQNTVCARCGKKFTPKRGGTGIRYGRICPKCYPKYRVDRYREWRRAKRGLCILCGKKAIPEIGYCEDHRDGAAEHWDEHKELIFKHFSMALIGRRDRDVRDLSSVSSSSKRRQSASQGSGGLESFD